MMIKSPIESLKIHFQKLTDPRVEHNINHQLIDIIMQGKRTQNLTIWDNKPKPLMYSGFMKKAKHRH